MDVEMKLAAELFGRHGLSGGHGRTDDASKVASSLGGQSSGRDQVMEATGEAEEGQRKMATIQTEG